MYNGLYELELAGCNEITEAGLWSCLAPRIVSLTLSDCINVADEAIGPGPEPFYLPCALKIISVGFYALIGLSSDNKKVTVVMKLTRVP
ncbi:unnamed protein product [Nezara viridula]|uniref:Uncharacterized protein n=1 Tax=Nezara viridula TaxID=85310 RepID=A0A9P0HED3_NEZVI|nr:unnamed protein product [Nezara viridula]